MKKSPLRRITYVLLAYLPVAWIVLGFAGWLRRVLALPQLFDSLLRGGLVLGLPLAALLAWKYPELGNGNGAISFQPPDRDEQP